MSIDTTNTVVAYFDLVAAPATLTVTRKGSGSGTVTGSGIMCGSDCSDTVAKSSTVTLTVVAASGATFMGWLGCDAPTDTACAMAMTESKTVAAIFNGTCTPNATRCVSGDPEVQERCSSTGTWTKENCAAWTLCVADACRVACGMTSPPAEPTLCMLPIADGVNDGAWRYWTDPLVTSPTYVKGGMVTRLDVAAEIRPAPSEAWPFLWRLAVNDFAVAVFRLDQFGPYRHPSFGYRARKAGVQADTTMGLFVGVFSPTALISSCTLSAPAIWAAAHCDVVTPLHRQFDYRGGTNIMFLGIDEPGVGGAVDLLDVNYAYLTVAP